MTQTQQRHTRGQQDEPEAEQLLTVGEVARILRVDTTTVRRYINLGALEAITLPHVGRRQAYRIKKSDIDDLTTPRKVK